VLINIHGQNQELLSDLALQPFQFIHQAFAMAAARFPKFDEHGNGGAFDHPVEIRVGHRLEA
jgi:hypothetical protein